MLFQPPKKMVFFSQPKHPSKSACVGRCSQANRIDAVYPDPGTPWRYPNAGGGSSLVGFVYERSQQESFEEFILVEMFAHFVVVLVVTNNYVLYIAVIPVLWSSFTQIFYWRFIIGGHGFALMWHVVTSPRTHCNPSKVSAELRLDHDGEVLQCAEQVMYACVCIYIY